MKVLGILGSPHADGPSSSLAREVLRGAEEAGHEVKIYSLKDMNIRGCQACGYCKAHWCDRNAERWSWLPPITAARSPGR